MAYDETDDWLTVWQTELAGMAADTDWAARMSHLIGAIQAFGMLATASWPSANGFGARDAGGTPGAAPADAASVAERLGAIERRLAALEPAPGV